MKRSSLLIVSLLVAALSLAETCYYPANIPCSNISAPCPDGQKDSSGNIIPSTCSSASFKNLATSSPMITPGSLTTAPSSGTCVYNSCWYYGGPTGALKIICGTTNTPVNKPWTGTMPGPINETACPGNGGGGS